MLGDLTAKKFTLSSVARSARYADGILFTRSSGKSVFLRAAGKELDCDRWAMSAVYAVTGEPALGTRPTVSFIPEYADINSQPAVSVAAWQEEPKYTFRVVGIMSATARIGLTFFSQVGHLTLRESLTTPMTETP